METFRACLHFILDDLISEAEERAQSSGRKRRICKVNWSGCHISKDGEGREVVGGTTSMPNSSLLSRPRPPDGRDGR